MDEEVLASNPLKFPVALGHELVDRPDNAVAPPPEEIVIAREAASGLDHPRETLQVGLHGLVGVVSVNPRPVQSSSRQSALSVLRAGPHYLHGAGLDLTVKALDNARVNFVHRRLRSRSSAE